MIRPTTQIGHPVLRKRAKEITLANVKAKNVQNLVHDLIDSMRAHDLVGMAAPQIGKGVRVFVTEIRETKARRGLKEADGVRVYINPRIVESSSTQKVLYEGCGSLAHARLFGPVLRPTRVTIEALDERGESFRFTARGLLAKVIQHELDHLDGTICVDRFTDTRRIMDREEYLNKTP